MLAWVELSFSISFDVWNLEGHPKELTFYNDVSNLYLIGYRARVPKFDNITERQNVRQSRKSVMNGTFDIELEQVLPFLGVSRNLFHRIGGDTANSICLMFFTKISIK